MENFEIESTQFPPGFRFFPTDQELIVHYLRKKVYSLLTPANYIIADIDLYKFNPWELPVKAFFGEGEWFFFSPRDRKYPNGSRPNRSAGFGYWKATGSDKPILDIGGSQCIGVKKSLVFYKGRPPKGTKTDWVMHEYRLLDALQPSSTSKKHKCSSMRLDDWVLCRVKNKGTMQTENVDQIEKRITRTTEQGGLLQMNAGLDEWSENKVLEFTPYGSVSSSETFNFDLGTAEPMHPVSSLLESMKRELSFGTLDELMLQARSNFHETCEQFSEYQEFTDFII